MPWLSLLFDSILPQISGFKSSLIGLSCLGLRHSYASQWSLNIFLYLSWSFYDHWSHYPSIPFALWKPPCCTVLSCRDTVSILAPFVTDLGVFLNTVENFKNLLFEKGEISCKKACSLAYSYRLIIFPNAEKGSIINSALQISIGPSFFKKPLH